MDKYRRISDPLKESAIFPSDESVVRVQVSGKIANYVSYAERVLSAADNKRKVELVALGRAIHRAVTVGEIVRRKHGLHQQVGLRSVSIRDKYVPIEEGLDPIEMDRTSSCISIMLAKSSSLLDATAPGYSSPLEGKDGEAISEELIMEMDQERAGAGARRANNNGNSHRGRGRGRARGRGRGRGRGRRREGDQNGTNSAARKSGMSAEALVTAPSN